MIFKQWLEEINRHILQFQFFHRLMEQEITCLFRNMTRILFEIFVRAIRMHKIQF